MNAKPKKPAEHGQYALSLKELTLGDGQTIFPGPLTVFIGPNNAGKTRALRDIANELTGSAEKPVILQKVTYTRPKSFAELEASAYATFFSPADRGSRWQDLMPDLCTQHVCETHLRWPEGFYLLWDEAHELDSKLLQAGLQDRQLKDCFGYLFGSRLVTFLRTAQRLQLLNDGNLGADTPQNLIEVLLRADQSIEDRIHVQFASVFGTDFVIDYSQLNRLRIVIGPADANLPQHPRQQAKALSSHLPLAEQGDGMRAFLGLLVALEAIDRPIILLDEPETFLHPPQARRIGELIGSTRREGTQVVVATHSVDVLRGILSVNPDTRVVRLDRTANLTKATVLEASHLAEVAADPILSSTRTLDGLFYSCAVIVEGERDARFYQAVADRMKLQIAPYFLISGGKQTAPKLAEEYRRLKIPVAVIVDFDVLREETLFRQMLTACGASKQDVDRLCGLRSIIEHAVLALGAIEHRVGALRMELESLTAKLALTSDAGQTLSSARTALKRMQTTADPWREAKQRGINVFDGETRMGLDALLCGTESHGLFVCPEGELEGFWSDISATDKGRWLQDALKRVAKYQVDDNELPWRFIRTIAQYLESGSTPERHEPLT